MDTPDIIKNISLFLPYNLLVSVNKYMCETYKEVSWYKDALVSRFNCVGNKYFGYEELYHRFTNSGIVDGINFNNVYSISTHKNQKFIILATGELYKDDIKYDEGVVDFVGSFFIPTIGWGVFLIM